MDDDDKPLSAQASLILTILAAGEYDFDGTFRSISQ